MSGEQQRSEALSQTVYYVGWAQESESNAIREAESATRKWARTLQHFLTWALAGAAHEASSAAKLARDEASNLSQCLDRHEAFPSWETFVTARRAVADADVANVKAAQALIAWAFASEGGGR